MANQADTYLRIRGINWKALGTRLKGYNSPPLVDGMLVRWGYAPSIKFAVTDFKNTWVEKGTVSVKCFAPKQHNTPAQGSDPDCPIGRRAASAVTTKSPRETDGERVKLLPYLFWINRYLHVKDSRKFFRSLVQKNAMKVNLSHAHCTCSLSVSFHNFRRVPQLSILKTVSFGFASHCQLLYRQLL